MIQGSFYGYELAETVGFSDRQFGFVVADGARFYLERFDP